MSSAGARYRISRRLGQGGMAEVFEAEVVGELGFVRKVAIKRMLADAAVDAAAARRFLDEANIASRLHHANIVGVTDVGLLDGLPFQVLELVDGLDAQQLLHRAGGKLPLEVALAIVSEVAHALDHAHRATDANGSTLGVVHRDVKPSNVLVSWSGDVKLADFGIALARDRASRTETGIVAGTAGFIAPEQRTRSEVDGRADVFALGLTLHALLVGYTPLRDVVVEMALLDGAALPLDATLPEDVRAIIGRAVAPARLDRPSAGELASAIGGVLAPRLVGDAHSLLRDFMSTLAEAPNRPKPGALDALLGIDVVPEAAPSGQVRHYKTIAAARSEAPTQLARPASAHVAPRGRAGLIAATVVVVGGLGALGIWQLGRPSATSKPTTIDAAPLALAAEPDAAVVAIAEPDAAVVAAEPDAALVRLDAASHRPGKPRPELATPPPPDAPAVVETGWMQVIGGEELVGAQVLVDGGKWKFSVPHRFEVTVGTHRIEVIKPDGTRLPARTLEVTTFHTLRNIAKLTL